MAKVLPASVTSDSGRVRVEWIFDFLVLRHLDTLYAPGTGAGAAGCEAGCMGAGAIAGGGAPVGANCCGATWG